MGAIVSGDRVLETTTTSGTGTITLLGAVTGYRTFASVATNDGDNFFYVIASASEWEVGRGVRQSSTTFSRDEVMINSSGGNTQLNFSGGTKECWIDLPAKVIAHPANNNYAFNSAGLIDQINVNTGMTGINSSRYIADMWAWSILGTTCVVTKDLVEDGPPGIRTSIRIGVSTADASPSATAMAVIRQFYEGYRVLDFNMGFGTSTSKGIGLGFWSKANRTGQYGGAIKNWANTRAYPFSYVMQTANTWQWNSWTIAVDPSSGAWPARDNAGSWMISFALMAQGSLVGTANAWANSDANSGTGQINGVAATSDNFYITGLCLVMGQGPTAEQSVTMVRQFDDDLTLCQRQLEKSFDYGIIPAQNAGINKGESVFGTLLAGASTQQGWWVPFKVRKRLFPGLTFYNPSAANAQARNLAKSTDATSTALRTGGEAGFQITFVGPAGGAVGDDMGVHWLADSRL